MSDQRRRSGLTLAAVAESAGVSQTTVSNAYNRPDQLSPALRAQVLAVARELGYRGPNPAARAMALGARINTIGLVMAERMSYVFDDPAALSMIRGLAHACEEADVSLTLLPVKGRSAEEEERVIRLASVDALVVHSVADDDGALAVAADRGLPLIVVDQPSTTETSFIGLDNLEGGRLAGQHLATLGHRRLAVLSFPFDDSGRHGLASPSRETQARFEVVRQRIAGYRLGLRGVADELLEVLVFECGDARRGGGAEAARQLLSSRQRPTALMCMSDELALGALSAALQLGLRVPEDVSIIGFDDVPEAARCVVPLTTVAQPLYEKGQLLARWILKPQGAPRRRTFPVTLLQRASTAPAPLRRRLGRARSDSTTTVA